MVERTRRDFLAGVGVGVVTAALPVSARSGEAPQAQSPRPPFRIRTITAGVTIAGAEDLSAIDRTLAMLARAKARFEQAGHEVQTIRIATNPIVAIAGAPARRAMLPALEALDRTVSARQAVISIGPVLTEDRVDTDLPAWCAELVQRTRAISFSAMVASGAHGVHRQACATAANIIISLSQALAGGVANFRFAAAANIPAGTPFFPVGFHEAAAALAVGLESPGLVQAAFAEAHDPEDAVKRLRASLNTHLGGVEHLARALAADEGVRYLGIDPSPAPGLDNSIGAAIEALTRVPFGSASTLSACATITAALKSLSVTTCGYAGLMLPVLEDPVLASRAQEGRYGVEELLLYSSVCGTGLDVVPIPGSTSAETVTRLIGDVAALSARLRKPLSARLFPAPGRKAGELVHFDDPRLTATTVFEVN
jgi:uncharacterized protein (UPF0210 family)